MTVNDMSEERQQSYINELKRCVKEDCDFYLEHNETYEFNNYINQLQQENQKYKEVIDKLKELIESKNNGVCVINGKEKEAFTFLLDFDKAREFIWKLLEILKEVE